MEVKILSTEYIKPSSPTPDHPRTYKMSLLDHFAPNVYVPFIFFYQANKASDISKTSQVLKQSLSRTLSLYYPLAGRANDNLSIDCDDEGASYSVASVNCTLSDYLKQPILSTLLKFVPDVALTLLPPGAPVLMVQQTVFSCGGIAIGFVYTHTVFDGGALGAFMKTWSTIARESTTRGADLSPNFSASSIFPPITTETPLDLTFLNKFLCSKGKFVVRRFGFDGSVISNLKAKATSLGVQNPTRVEVVSAVLYKCIISALEAKSGTKKSALITNGVNMRRKAVPPFSDTFVGNFVLSVAMETQAEDTDLCSFVRRMREATSPINGEFVKSLQGEEGVENFFAYIKGTQESLSKAASKGVEPIGFNSWCNAGLLDVDYGWGKPLWVPVVIFAKAPPQILIQLTDTRHANGVEAWVVLDEESMSLLEHDKELLSLASVDPSPLQIGSLSKGKFVVRRFGFDGSAIGNLKAKATSLGVQNPTRVEVVSAVLYKCIISALEAKSGTKKSALITNGVNMRRKAVPPFSDTFVGNFVWLVAMETQAEDTDLCSFVRRMREATSPINGEFVKSLQGEEGVENFCSYIKGTQESLSKAASKGVEPIGFNSWCNAGLLDVDYGWGKPLWVPVVTFAKAPPQIFIQLTDTRHANGVEAWVVLDEESMSLLEHDKELLSLASVDPSPLQIGSLRSNL